MIAKAVSSTIPTQKAAFKIRGQNGPYRNQSFPIGSTHSFMTVGSGKECDLSLGNLTFFTSPEEQNHVASVHGMFIYAHNGNPNEIEYMDFGSKQVLGEGYVSEINTEQLTVGKKYPLKAGDTIKIGDLVFKLEKIRNRFLTLLSKTITPAQRTARLLRRVAAGLLLP